MFLLTEFRDYNHTDIRSMPYSMLLKLYEPFPHSEVSHVRRTATEEGQCRWMCPAQQLFCKLEKEPEEKLVLRTRHMLLLPDILSRWRIQKWCLTAAGPTPTLQPCGMCSVWATAPVIKAVTVGRAEASTPGPRPQLFLPKRRHLF